MRLGEPVEEAERLVGERIEAGKHLVVEEDSKYIYMYIYIYIYIYRQQPSHSNTDECTHTNGLRSGVRLGLG